MNSNKGSSQQSAVSDQRKEMEEKLFAAVDAFCAAADRWSIWTIRIGLPILVGVALGYAWRMAQGF